MVTSDLGALGDATSPPLECQWSVWDHLRLRSPWWLPLALLGLLCLRPNRHPQAWWIWVPVLVGCLLVNAIPEALASAFDAVEEAVIPHALGFLSAWAAIWALAPVLSRRSRWGTALLTLLVAVLGGIAGTLADTGDLPEGIEDIVVVALLLLVPTLALLLAGVDSRRTYGPLRFCAKTLGVLVVGWLLLPLPLVFANGDLPDRSYLTITATIALAQFALLLPFLLLSFLQPFHRARFERWLKLPGPAGPPSGQGGATAVAQPASATSCGTASPM